VCVVDGGPAGILLGADGRHSAIRRLGKFPIEYEHHDFDVIWFVVDPPPDWSRTIYFSVGGTPLLLVGRLSPLFTGFTSALRDFTPFVPLPGGIFRT